MSSSTPPEPGPELLAPLREQPGRSAIVLDVDGTLAPIVPRPDEASVPDRTRALLAGLNRRYALVACLSGRRAADARRVVGVDSLTYVGNHGLEYMRPGAEHPETLPEGASHADTVRSFVATVSSPSVLEAGIRLEDKQSIWAFHWRGAPDEASARGLLEQVAHEASESGLVPHWGRKVLEIRPPLAVDKGTAIERLLRGVEVDAALYAGDDTTDLDAFRKLRELRTAGALKQAVSVGVRSEEGPPELAGEADLTVDGPDGLRDLFAQL